MKIVVCPKCGRKIHLAEKCLYCGNSEKFQIIDNANGMHEKAVDEYRDLIELLSHRSYDQVIELSNEVLRKLPMFAEVFWIRLLARNKCSVDLELVQRGVNFKENAEYFNAFRYASDIEKEVYLEIRKLVEKVRKEFENAIIRNEYEEKRATSILEIQTEFSREIKVKREKLFELWSKLEQLEQKMKCIENECDLLLNEHKETLKRAQTESLCLKKELYSCSMCTEEQFHDYQLRLETLLSQSNESKSAIATMRSQQLFTREFSELVAKREEISNQISGELSQLKMYRARIQSTIIEAEKIEKKHRLLMRALSNYDFRNVYSLIGTHKYEEALHSAGLAVISANCERE